MTSAEPGDHSQTHFAIQAWRDGQMVDWWAGHDEILARDAARELFAHGYDVEVFTNGQFVGWVEHADGTLASTSGTSEPRRDGQLPAADWQLGELVE